ncbi:MAG: hypothetical protein Aurels2KO_21610 [Aureliella sp.]
MAGTATINSVGSTLNVNASSDRAVVNWNSFSVGQGNTANFNLPSASSAILNRVTTPGVPSVIAGQLNSNGNVFLVNPSGVVVGNTGVINTNGFTASTFDTTNRQFMDSGPMSFRGSSTAGIVNNGTINTGAGGAHFIGNQFNNNGNITSAGGTITVGSGQAVTYANGVTHVEADMATLQNGYSETAGLINNSGTLRATGAVMTGGDVYLTSPGGRVINSGLIGGRNVAVNSGQFNTVGTIDASGNVGGNVVVQSNDALIQGTIDASGTVAGGRVQIDSGTADQFATIDASATSGTGGNVTITTASGYTATTAGNINVDGASGGEVTISGTGRIVSSATISAQGTNGDGGKINVASEFKTSLLGATLDASGSIDGGQIRVGGEYQGGKDLTANELANSAETLISPGSQLIARGEKGEGGTAIVWSDDRTQFFGGVDVRGSGADGSGGFVELSSAGLLNYQTTDAVLTGGGTVLLDPKNGVIVDTAPTGLSVIEFALASDAEASFGDPADFGGTSVSLNSDGTLLAVGAPGDDGGSAVKMDSGAVYLFELAPDNLRETPASLLQIIRDGTALETGMLDLDPGDFFGQSVAINGLGSILAVGATGDDPAGFDPLTGDSALSATGAVYLFELNLSGSGIGTIVAPADLRQVIRDGSALAGGGTFDLLDNEVPGTDFTQRGLDEFGASVALSAAGNRLAVGTFDSFAPRVFLFELNTANLSTPADLAQTLGTGSDVGAFTLMPEQFDDFGNALALNATGNLLAVGAPGEIVSGGFLQDGAVYLFELDPADYGVGAQFQQKLATGSALAGGGTLMTTGTRLGAGLAFANNGQILAMGANSLRDFNGGVVAVGLDPSNPSQSPLLIQSSVVEDLFLDNGTPISLVSSGIGSALALSRDGEVLAIGTPSFDGLNGQNSNSGGALLFSVDVANGSVEFERTISDLGSAENLPVPGFESFGNAVALNNDATRLAIGSNQQAFGDDGQVFLFSLDPSDLGQTPTLNRIIQEGVAVGTPVGPEILQFDNGDGFGSALSFNATGDRLAVGAPGDDFTSASNTDKGAIYLFELGADSDSVFLPQVIRQDYTFADGSMLTLPNSSEFGSAIALDGPGNRLVAGLSRDRQVLLLDFGPSGFGSPATLAQTIGNGSVLADGSTLNLGVFDAFGSSVAINDNGGVLAVGELAINRSSVFLFDLDANDWTTPADLGQQLQNSTPLAGGGSLIIGDTSLFGSAVGLSAVGDRLVVAQRGTRLSLFELDVNDLSSPVDMVGTVDDDTFLESGVGLNPSFAFGGSVSLDGSGNVIAVGEATGIDTRPGQAYLFEFESGDYADSVTVQQAIGPGSPVSEFTGLQAGQAFGRVVAMDRDGDRLAIASLNNIFLFDTDTSLSGDPVLAQIIRAGSRLADGQLLVSDSFARPGSMDFNGDGTLLAVGASRIGFGTPDQVALFSLDDADFSSAPNLRRIIGSTPSTGIRSGFDISGFDDFGSSVALSDAGDRLAVGSRLKDGLDGATFNSGAVYLFDLDLDQIVNPVTLGLIIEDGSSLNGGGTLALEEGNNFGLSVGLNAAGDRLAVGSPGSFFGGADPRGMVHLFELNPTDSSAAPRLGQVLQDGTVLSDGQTLNLDNETPSILFDSADRFGVSVALDASGATLFVGAPGDDGIANDVLDAGAVYRFDLNRNDYRETASLNRVLGVGYAGNPGGIIDITDGDRFGSSVAVTSATEILAVGAPGADFLGDNVRTDTGSVFLIGVGGGIPQLTGDLLFTDDPGSTTFIDPDDIAAILNAGNDLTLQFSNDLEIRSDIMTASSGVGTLTVQTGRSITVLPGTSIDVGDGSLDFEFNSSSALAGQTDPGDPRLLLNDVSIVASGDNSLLKFSGGEQDDYFTLNRDPLIQVFGSTISAQEVEFGSPQFFGADHRIAVGGGTVISGDAVTVRGSSSRFGIGVEIAGAGTEIAASGRLVAGGIGGMKLLEGAALRGVGQGTIGIGMIQAGNEPVFEPITRFGDSLNIENASIVTENGDVTFELASVDVLTGGPNPVFIDDQPKLERNSLSMIDSEILAGGMGDVLLVQAGDDSYNIDLSGSTISGKDVLIASNVFAFSTEAGSSTVNLSNQSQINTAVDGELRIFLPQQNSFMIDASSSLNGVTGNSVFDDTGNLRNNQGIGEFVGEEPTLPFDIEYIGTEDANFALYIATVDLTPGLFFTANDGQSTYGQTPVDPGVSITRGVLLDGDTLESLGVGTDFNLNQFSDAGTYTLNVTADRSELNPKYRLLGTAEGTFTILPADLFVSGGAYSKTYGESFVFPENDFTVEGLVNNETIGPVQWLSLGTRPTADVMNAPYEVGLNVASAGGFNPMNYNINFTNGGLTVTPAPLTINPLAQSKVYGDSMLDQSRFNAVGLRNGETISGVSFTSPGIAGTADVGDYNLRAAMVTGSGNGFDPGNYNVQFGSLTNGLTVTPASLLIRPIDQFKLVGESFVFAGNEFTASGLKNSDSVANAVLASDGAAEEAELGTFPIVLTDFVGNFDPNNYVIQVLTGDFIVQEEPVAPAGVLSTGQLVYDQLERYRLFAETIDALAPSNAGSIDTSNALPPEQPTDDEPNDSSDEPEDDDNEVYLSTTTRVR